MGTSAKNEKKPAPTETQRLDGVRLSTRVDKTYIAQTVGSCQITSGAIFFNCATAAGYLHNGQTKGK